jgi:hypothetical protein
LSDYQRSDTALCVAASRHLDAAEAVGEVVGAVLDRLDPHPGLLLAFVAQPLAEQLAAISTAIRSLLAPEVLVAGTVSQVSTGPGPPDTLAVLATSGQSVTAIDSTATPDDSTATVGDRPGTRLLFSNPGAGSIDRVPSGQTQWSVTVSPAPAALNSLILDDHAIEGRDDRSIGFLVDGLSGVVLDLGSPELSSPTGRRPDSTQSPKGALLLVEPLAFADRSSVSADLDLLYDLYPDTLIAATVRAVDPPGGRRGIDGGYLASVLEID